MYQFTSRLPKRSASTPDMNVPIAPPTPMSSDNAMPTCTGVMWCETMRNFGMK